jgi:hypothetical protein
LWRVRQRQNQSLREGDPPSPPRVQLLPWTTRFRRLARDCERLLETVRGLHLVAFACLMLKHAALVLGP